MVDDQSDQQERGIHQRLMGRVRMAYFGRGTWILQEDIVAFNIKEGVLIPEALDFSDE